MQIPWFCHHLQLQIQTTDLYLFSPVTDTELGSKPFLLGPLHLPRSPPPPPTNHSREPYLCLSRLTSLGAEQSLISQLI